MCVSINLMRDTAQEKVDMAKLYSLCDGSFALEERKVVSNYFNVGENQHIKRHLEIKAILLYNAIMRYQRIT